MHRSFATVLVAGLVVAGAGGLATPHRVAAATPTYTVEDLGTLPGDYASAAWGINQFGDVVGWSMGPTGTRAFLYTSATGMTALPAPDGRPVTTARAISANGTVVGTASTGGSDIGHAVRWQAGMVQDLGTLGTGNFSDARAVNSAGDIVGSSYSDGGAVLGIHAFRFSDATGMVDLTPTSDLARAEGINDSGQVTGSRNGRAFRLTGTTFTDLGTAGYANSFGYAINSSGQVAGHVISGDGNVERIFRWTNGQMVILGGFGEHNTAFGINTAGDVVGWGWPTLDAVGRQGFLYTDANGMQGLNALIDPASGWFILGAGGINDAGQIVGWASGFTGQRAVRLTPGSVASPTPPAAPSGLTGSGYSASEILLRWADNSGSEVGFRIQRALGTQGSFVPLAQVGANTTLYIDGTVKAGKTYRYRVLAFNGAGDSAWSNTVSVRASRR
jgi:probable HAF family extracellular repeat protein